MNRIISTLKVRKRLSLLDDDGINAAIESARDAALLNVSHVLDFVTEASDVVDTFFIDLRRETAVDGLYTLRLSSGFVGMTPVLEVRVGDSLEALQASSPLPGTTYLLAPEKGFLKLPASYGGMYVRVSYRAGIEDEADAPDWLVEVMIGSTIKVMSQQQIQDGKQEITKVIPALEKHVAAIMDKHLRCSSIAVRPIG